MKANEIKVGGIYIAKVNGGETEVKVLSTGLGGYGNKQRTTYQVENLRTKRKTMFRSAAKFRAPAKDEQVIAATVKLSPRKRMNAPPTALIEQASQQFTAEYPMPLSDKTRKAMKEAAETIIAMVKESAPLIDATHSTIPAGVSLVKRAKSKPATQDETFDLCKAFEDGDPRAVEIVRAENKAENENRPVNPVTKKLLKEQIKNGGFTPNLPSIIARVEAFQHSAEEKEIFAEIVLWEAKHGKKWTEVAEKDESWSSFKRRGAPSERKPLTAPEPVKSIETPKAPPAPQTKPPVAPIASPKPAAIPAPATLAKQRAPREGGMSSKETVYRAWLQTDPTKDTDIPALVLLVPAVQAATVRTWVRAWEKGNEAFFPSIAKELPPSTRGVKKETPKPAAAPKKQADPAKQAPFVKPARGPRKS